MRSMQCLSDTELIRLFYEGRESAFDVLLRRYQKEVRTVLMHYVKDAWLAEDLSQDVFLKIYTSLKCRKYAEEGKFLPWALRISRNLCFDYLRKAAQLPPAKQPLSEDQAFTPAHHNAEHRMVARQREEQVAAFIRGLPDDQQKVVRYRFFEDLSFKEIAVLMNTSVNTSLGRMRYGLAHLRKQMKGKETAMLGG